jgi:SAM-dependent methyltransferase
MTIDYTPVTEVPENRVTQEQLTRIYHRYRFASDLCQEKDVLEVGCGAGLGLGYLAGHARRVVAGDYTESLVQRAKGHYGQRIGLCALDAHRLPFRDGTFDVVILHEAIYYLASAETFVQEACRLLRQHGILLIGTVNKDWPEFNPSPYSTRYYAAEELVELLRNEGLEVKLYGAFMAGANDLKEKAIAMLRRIAVPLRLIPQTMKGKEYLKRIFYGKLVTLGGEIHEGLCQYDPPVTIPSEHADVHHKIIYAVGRVSSR